METHKHLTDHSSNEKIREAIRAIALRGIVSQKDGTIKGTNRISGFVTKIHLDEDDELYGTIDVQEYPDWAMDETEEMKIGYHEGVRLSAIQQDLQGYVIIPKLHSEVMVGQDPSTGVEYVTLYSHVDLIQLDSHESISIGVREREEYDPEDENAPDIDKLELTGNLSNTSYGVNYITSFVTDKNEKDYVKQVLDPTQITQTVGDDETISSMTKDGMTIMHGEGAVEVIDSETTLTQGNSKVKVTDGVVYVGDDAAVDDAVLGSQLASILEEMLDALAQVKTTTQLGPQPFLNLAQFVSLKAKISAFKGAHSGFLTQKVQIQK